MPSTETSPIRLRVMCPAEFDDYTAVSADEYYADLLRAWNMPPDAAAAKVASDFSNIREKGPDGDDETVFVIERTADGTSVGALWVDFSPQGGRNVVFVYDIRIDTAWRKRGYGRAALAAAEAWGRTKGAERIGLHVFGDNSAARSLYRSCGYAETSVQMSKML